MPYLQFSWLELFSEHEDAKEVQIGFCSAEEYFLYLTSRRAYTK